MYKRQDLYSAFAFTVWNRTLSASSPSTQQQRRGYWLRTLHQWHWISAAVCLIGMLLFAVTGITLNHAAQIEAKPVVVHLSLIHI